ncbi:unnamed protein product, partial [Brachionus calyciflorus]
MNKNWIKENFNDSPSLKRLRSRRIIASNQSTVNKQQEIIESVEPKSMKTVECIDNPVVTSFEKETISCVHEFRSAISLDLSISSSESSSSNIGEESEFESSFSSSSNGSDTELDDDEFFYKLTEEMNKMSITTNDFLLSKTIRGAAKLCSLGFYYTKERETTKGKIH